MSAKSFNNDLHAAKKAKKDEFYTQRSDIEKELKDYVRHFKGKTVYCNCDDPSISHFFGYFSSKFEELKLKRLITTCYKSRKRDLFSQNKAKKAIYLEYTGNKGKSERLNLEDIGVNHLNGNGDFRSEECVNLLKRADIVSTNPPFSLFREYVAQLVKHNKKFVIIGNMNAVTYKEIFKLIKENKLWLGASIQSGDREFGVPDDYPLTAAGYRIDENGKKYIRVKGVRWFTNLDIAKRHEDLILYETYKGNESAYPKYDNYDAINVDKTRDIPVDYEGVMGVPITFLDKYNPNQFEILGNMATTKVDGYNYGYPYIGGEKKYARILIRSKKPCR